MHYADTYSFLLAGLFAAFVIAGGIIAIILSFLLKTLRDILKKLAGLVAFITKRDETPKSL